MLLRKSKIIPAQTGGDCSVYCFKRFNFCWGARALVVFSKSSQLIVIHNKDKVQKSPTTITVVEPPLFRITLLGVKLACYLFSASSDEDLS